MANIIISGLSPDANIHLATTKKYDANTPLQPGEYIHHKKDGTPSQIRKRLTSRNLSDFQVNGVFAREFEWEGSKTLTYSIAITHNGKRHYINLGSTNLARSVVNSFLSLSDKTAEELSQPIFSIGFYDNQNGYGQAAVSFGNEKLAWKYSIEEQNPYITKTEFKGKMMTDTSRLDEFFKQHLDELNKKFPHAEVENALDALDDATEYQSNQQTSNTDTVLQDAEDIFGPDIDTI